MWKTTYQSIFLMGVSLLCGCAAQDAIIVKTPQESLRNYQALVISDLKWDPSIAIPKEPTDRQLLGLVNEIGLNFVETLIHKSTITTVVVIRQTEDAEHPPFYVDHKDSKLIKFIGDKNDLPKFLADSKIEKTIKLNLEVMKYQEGNPFVRGTAGLFSDKGKATLVIKSSLIDLANDKVISEAILPAELHGNLFRTALALTEPFSGADSWHPTVLWDSEEKQILNWLSGQF